MVNNHNLSEGALQIIMRGGQVDTPLVQVLGTKKINSGAQDKERYRILLSDGKYTISFAMLTTQINDKIMSNNSIIKLQRYVTSMVNNSSKGEQRILLILDLELVVDGEEVGGKIGSPTPLTDNASDNSTSKPTPSTSNGTSSISVSKPAMSTMNNSSMNMNGQITHPISSLSPYHNKWIIKARVTNKSAIRTWNNARGEGKLFSFDLIDESGEIRVTAFKEMVEKFYDYLQVDKVYYISKCQLKPANKQFSTLKNEYEMTIGNETVIQECSEDVTNIPQTKYDFVSIDKIANMESGTLLDIVAICKQTSDIQTFTSKSTGRELKKKEVTLIDQSRTAVSLTLWGADAESFDGSNNPVIVIKGAKLGEYGGGKNLSTIASSQIKINPEMPECYKMKGWYDSEGSTMDTTNISAMSGAGGFNTPWLSFKAVQDQGLGHAEKGDYYQVMGTILLIRSENAMYKACPTENCNKKVIDFENNMYRCEKCNREFPNFKYRLLANMNVGDWSGNQWISMFSSEAEKVLGMTAQEVGERCEAQPDDITSIMEKVHFSQFILKCRAKMETYNDESRLKTVAVKVDPINYEEYNAHLIESIQQLISA